MKKYILFIIAAALLTACELNLKSDSDLLYTGYWESEDGVKAAHIGVYAKYREYANTFWQMGELRSDAWGGATIESPEGSDLIANNISSTTVHFSNWANLYGLMHNLNDFLKNAPQVNFKNETDKNHLIGQVYGIRAMVYYTMLRAWGKVPLTTEPLDPLQLTDLSKLKKKRAPEKEVMEQVKADIAASLKLFGDNNSLWLNKRVYWSKAATLALKGDVYLWSGKVLGGGQSDFTEAKKALEAVSGFELVPYANLWGQQNENNKEFIFAIDYAQNQADNYYSKFTGRAVDIRPLNDEKGNSMSAFVASGASRFGPSDKTLLALNDADDARSATFIRLYNDKKPHIPFVAGESSYKGSILAKFLGIVGEDGTRKNYNNVPVYRYADVLLLLAEAKNSLGEDPSAEINNVRERAYGDKFSAHKFKNSSKTENQKAILNERYKEFIGEGKRWWDLVRAGDGVVFEEVKSLKAAEAHKIYYSISDKMIADDPELDQTTGY